MPFRLLFQSAADDHLGGRGVGYEREAEDVLNQTLFREDGFDTRRVALHEKQVDDVGIALLE